jgi:hypothetical protein
MDPSLPSPTQPSPPSTTPLAPFPSLPTELVFLVIHLALPPPNYTDWQERSSLLRAFCLVNSGWRRWAQRKLFAHVVLPNEDHARRWLLMREEGGREERAGAGGYAVTSLRIGDKEAASAEARYVEKLGELLRSCPGLEELWMWNVWVLRVGELAYAPRKSSAVYLKEDTASLKLNCVSRPSQSVVLRC